MDLVTRVPALELQEPLIIISQQVAELRFGKFRRPPTNGALNCAHNTASMRAKPFGSHRGELGIITTHSTRRKAS